MFSEKLGKLCNPPNRGAGWIESEIALYLKSTVQHTVPTMLLKNNHGSSHFTFRHYLLSQSSRPVFSQVGYSAASRDLHEEARGVNWPLLLLKELLLEDPQSHWMCLTMSPERSDTLLGLIIPRVRRSDSSMKYAIAFLNKVGSDIALPNYSQQLQTFAIFFLSFNIRHFKTFGRSVWWNLE